MQGREKSVTEIEVGYGRFPYLAFPITDSFLLWVLHISTLLLHLVEWKDHS